MKSLYILLITLMFAAMAPARPASAQSAPDFAKIHQQILAEYDTVHDAQLESVIRNVIVRLNEGRATIDVPVITLIDEDTVNAFTIGRGYVYVHLGLLAQLETEAELAMVLGHELAHGDREHSSNGGYEAAFAKLVALRAARRAAMLGRTPFSKAAAASLGAAIGAKGGQALFSRMQERSADYYGLQYLAAGGYNTKEGAKAMDRLGGSISPGMWMRSHPLSQERKVVLTNLSNQYPGGDYVGRIEYVLQVHRNALVASLRAAAKSR